MRDLYFFLKQKHAVVSNIKVTQVDSINQLFTYQYFYTKNTHTILTQKRLY